jgi:hypothetical protein
MEVVMGRFEGMALTALALAGSALATVAWLATFNTALTSSF